VYLVGFWYSTLYIVQHIYSTVMTPLLQPIAWMMYLICEYVCVCVCVCVCVYLYNYEGGNVLYHILWNCFYKVKIIPYLGVCCSENGVVDFTPDVFLGIVVGGRRGVWITCEFHVRLLLLSRIQLLWFLGYFTTCLDHPVLFWAH